MKQLLTLTAALIASATTMAHETARVVSATPVMERVAVPRQVCTVEHVSVGRRGSGRGEDVPHCTTQTVFEYRPVAYDVVYDHAGQHHAVRTSSDPGSRIHVGTAPTAPVGVSYQTWQAAPAAPWYGHRRYPAVPYVSAQQRGNTWEEDFLDRQMR